MTVKKTTLGLLALWVLTVIIGIIGLGKHFELRRLHSDALAQADHYSRQQSVVSAAEPRVAAEASRLARAEKLELMRLRNEVTQLRASSVAANKEKETLQKKIASQQQAIRPASVALAEGSNVGLPREEWTFRGYGTPEDSLISSFWASREGDLNIALEAMTPDARAQWEQLNAGKTEEAKKAAVQRQVASTAGFRIKGQEQVSPTEVILSVETDREQTISKTMRMKLVGNEWKADPEANYDPLAFYRKNPELMKRYFPHLSQQQE